MHTSYFFLHRLIEALRPRLVGLQWLSCFSQQRDELIVGLANAADECWLRVQLGGGPVGTGGCLVNVIDQFARAKRNTADLFEDLLGLYVKDLQVSAHDRSFTVFLGGEGPTHATHALRILLYGPHSNAIAYQLTDQQWEGISCFHHKKEETDLKLPVLADVVPDWSSFEALSDKPGKWLPSIGPIPQAWLRQQGYFDAPLSIRRTLIETLLDYLLDTANPYFLVLFEGKPQLSLLEVGEVLATYHDPVKALNQFLGDFLRSHYLTLAKTTLLTKIDQRIRQTERYILKISERHQQLVTERNPEELGHLLMAHLHEIKSGDQEVVVQDWYKTDDSGAPMLLTIKLKLGQPAHKQAEDFYRKARNRQLERDHHAQQLAQKEALMFELMTWQDEVNSLTDYKHLRDWQKAHQVLDQTHQTGDAANSLPYKRFEFEGYEIRVGKNAADNDELTLKYSYKEDLWLHARGVTGSHVVIKHQAGKTIPQQVISYAAQLAVQYSKARNQTHFPVIVTPKKFVRKVKGSPPGAVLVSRETVLVV